MVAKNDIPKSQLKFHKYTQFFKRHIHDLQIDFKSLHDTRLKTNMECSILHQIQKSTSRHSYTDTKDIIPYTTTNKCFIHYYVMTLKLIILTMLDSGKHLIKDQKSLHIHFYTFFSENEPTHANILTYKSTF